MAKACVKCASVRDNIGKGGAIMITISCHFIKLVGKIAYTPRLPEVCETEMFSHATRPLHR